MPAVCSSFFRLVGVSVSCLVLFHLTLGFQGDVIELMLEPQRNHRWWFLTNVKALRWF